jgi:hypothetical protein
MGAEHARANARIGFIQEAGAASSHLPLAAFFLPLVALESTTRVLRLELPLFHAPFSQLQADFG